MTNWVVKYSLGLLKDNESMMWIIGMLIWDKNNNVCQIRGSWALNDHELRRT